jgi:hypothetical protein
MTIVCIWKGMRNLQTFMLCPDIILLLWVFRFSSCTPYYSARHMGWDFLSLSIMLLVNYRIILYLFPVSPYHLPEFIVF